MSKPFEQLTRQELAYILLDILEHNHQRIDPYCPWCGAENYGVDASGQSTDDDPDEYRCDHRPNCAVALIEAVYNGQYEYINKPCGRSGKWLTILLTKADFLSAIKSSSPSPELPVGVLSTSSLSKKR